MAVYLVRHAIALGRSEWDDDDELRPLTKRGERQAQGVAELLASAEVRRIASSPATRCVATVAPLAATLGLEVARADELMEGQNAKRAVDLAVDLAARKGDTVLCTHGDLVPEILRRLARAGTKVHGDHLHAKGSTWRLDWDTDHFTDARYTPPTD